MATNRETLKASLSTMDFPVSKERLVEFAENNGVDDYTLRALRSLPTADYANLTEVVRSVPLSKHAEAEQTDPQHARQAGQREKHGLAEHQHETSPNPIADELGENRRS